MNLDMFVFCIGFCKTEPGKSLARHLNDQDLKRPRPLWRFRRKQGRGISALTMAAWYHVLGGILEFFLLLFIFGQVDANFEGDALYALRRSLIDPANVLQSWDPTLVNPCTWFHVTCDKNNHVTRLDLGNGKLSGVLAPELGNLQYLEYLELYKNHLHGRIPQEFSKLKNLKSLDLYHNNLTGEIPKSLGGLTALRFLRLNNNNIKGQIPPELTHISSLRVMNLSNNDFCGTIPAWGSFSKFPAASFENNPRLKGPELMGSVPYYDGECK